MNDIVLQGEVTGWMEALVHPDKNIRSAVVVALGKTRELDALPALIGRMGTEPDFFVREDIAWALVRMGEKAVQPVAERLQDENPAVRHAAAHVLSKIGDSRATAALLTALHDTDEAVLTKTIFALSHLDVRRALPHLVQMLSHPSHEVQTALLQALEKAGESTLPLLTTALQDEQAQTRELAADALGMIGHDDAVQALANVLRDDEAGVRFAAATALRQIGGEEAWRALATLRDDPDARVRAMSQRMG